MLRQLKLMRKLLSYVPNMFLELPRKFGSNQRSNRIEAKSQIGIWDFSDWSAGEYC